MTPPKCRICGAREHNHRCQGGTPAMRVAEGRRQQLEAQVAQSAPEAPPRAEPTVAEQNAMRKAFEPSTRPRWHDDTDSAGEPVEVRDMNRKPARFYAPPGTCVYCDRRRDAARRSMASVRERGTDA